MSYTSFPKGIPLAKAVVSPTIFAIPVRNAKNSFNWIPQSIVFISGIPEPFFFKVRIVRIARLYRAKVLTRILYYYQQLEVRPKSQK